jgi:hypothetical protein
MWAGSTRAGSFHQPQKYHLSGPECFTRKFKIYARHATYCYMCEVSLVVTLYCYNNVTVQRRVSLDTQQCWTALAWLTNNNVNKQHCYARNNKTHATMVFGILLKSSVVWESFEWSWVREWVEVGCDSEHYGGRWRHLIVGAGKWRVNDVYAEVPLWSATGPIARRGIVPTCV